MPSPLVRFARRFAAVLSFALLGASGAALADDRPADQGDLQAAYDAAFQEMLRSPADLDAAFRYAALAIRLENYEAAIAALERMLLFNPNLSRARLELGALYYRLGSYEVARGYLVRALEDDELPDSARRQAQAYLDVIDDRTAPHRISGSVLFGARWQSNANAGPDSPEIRVLGANGVLSDEFTETDDLNLFASGSVLHSYDLGTQWPVERLETTGIGYLSRHRGQEQLDAGLVEVNSGPRFALFPNRIDATVRPFGTANYVWLGEESYFRTLGGGVEADYRPLERLRFKGAATYLDRDYNATIERPRVNDRDGHEWVFAVGGDFALTPTSLLTAVAELRDENLRVDFQSNREYRLAVGYTRQYPPPFGLTDQPWITAVSVARIWTDYGAPDPLVDPDVARADKEWRFGALTSVGVTEDWSLLVNLQRFVVDSNLPNFEYDNWSATFGAAFRF